MYDYGIWSYCKRCVVQSESFWQLYEWIHILKCWVGSLILSYAENNWIKNWNVIMNTVFILIIANRHAVSLNYNFFLNNILNFIKSCRDTVSILFTCASPWDRVTLGTKSGEIILRISCSVWCSTSYKSCSVSMFKIWGKKIGKDSSQV